MVLAAALVAVYEMEGSQITNKGNNLFPHVLFYYAQEKFLCGGKPAGVNRKIMFIKK